MGIIAAIYNSLLVTGVVTHVWDRIVGAVCIIVGSINPVVCFISIVDSQVGSQTMWNVVGELLDVDISFRFLQVWHIIALIYIGLSYLLLKLAAKNIAPVKKKRQKKAIN